MTTKQLVIEAIENIIAGDDFCDEMAVKNHARKFTGDKKVMYEKLTAIYHLAHAFNYEYKCYPTHEDWRRELGVRGV